MRARHDVTAEARLAASFKIQERYLLTGHSQLEHFYQFCL